MSGYVYFIACEPLEAVKIGFTKSNPYARLSALQTGCPAKLKLLCYFPGTIEEERRLHWAFDSLHIHLEWFRNEWKLSDFIYYLAEHQEGFQASREHFENTLHDVLWGGLWYPLSPISQEDYDKTGDWRPFADFLGREFGVEA